MKGVLEMHELKSPAHVHCIGYSKCTEFDRLAIS